MIFVYIDRKQESLFSVCLLNVSQGMKRNIHVTSKTSFFSVLSTNPFYKPTFIHKTINVNLLASMKPCSDAPQKGTCKCFQTRFHLFAQINVEKKLCKDFFNKFLCKVSIHHYGPYIRFWIKLNTFFNLQEQMMFQNKFKVIYLFLAESNLIRYC